MTELIDKWEVVSKLITLQNNYNFFQNEWDANRLYREIAKLEIEIGKISGLEVVRCKDCKHYVLHALACRHENFNGIIPMNGYCYYGERKDNATD